MNNARTLKKELIAALNAASDDGAFSFPLIVHDNYDQRFETFPRLVLRQMVNRPGKTVTADTREEMEGTTIIGYQFELYVRDAIDELGEVHSRIDVGDTLTHEVVEWLWVNYGLARNTWSMSSAVDEYTQRTVFRVNGEIDRHHYIYRR